MPPHAKITKEMILNAALEITRESGFAAVNARSIAARLQCSTRPLFSCYENMEALKHQFLSFAFDFYSQFVAEYTVSSHADSCLLFPLSYLAFAKQETFLFLFLFVDDMDLNMAQAKDFYQEAENLKKARDFAKIVGISPSRAEEIFLDLFFYAHGMAVLTATGKLSLREEDHEKLLHSLLDALLASKKSCGG